MNKIKPSYPSHPNPYSAWQSKEFTEENSVYTGSIKKMPETPKVILNDKLVNDIRLLHKQFNVEWSGIVFYEIVGDLPNCTIHVHDMLLLDIGSATFTSFDWNSRLVTEYLFMNEHLSNYRVGWIHTHHSMSTFFSGTDKQAFDQIAGEKDLALSIITNRKEDHIAQIGFKGSFKTQMVNHFGDSFKEQDFTGLIYWECDVTTRKYQNDALNDQINKVKAFKKEEAAKEAKLRSKVGSSIKIHESVPQFTNRPSSAMKSFQAALPFYDINHSPSSSFVMGEEDVPEEIELTSIVEEGVYDMTIQLMGKLINNHPNYADESRLWQGMLNKAAQSLDARREVVTEVLRAVSLLEVDDLVEIIGWTYLSNKDKTNLQVNGYIKLYLTSFKETAEIEISDISDTYGLTPLQKFMATAAVDDIVAGLSNVLNTEVANYINNLETINHAE